jgi:ubiquinol-cytochrome c reductase iron-sulfur subunit
MNEDQRASDHQQIEGGPPGTDERGDTSLLLPGHNDPIPDPGLPEHQYRPTDVDPALERRAERQVATMFALAGVLAVVFCVAYFAFSPEPGPGADTIGRYGLSNLTLGLSLGLALLLLGVGAIQWAKKLMGDHEIVEMRHTAASSEADREESLTAFRQGAEESGFGRRTLVRNTLLGSLALMGLPAVVLLRDLGPLPVFGKGATSANSLEHTVWRKGVRVVNDVSGAPLKPSEIEIGQLINAEPSLFFQETNADGTVVPPQYEGTELQVEKGKAAVIVVRMQPDDIHPYPSRADWGVQGILCYSKICTHVGCPISLWEQQTHHLLCPCHQSTFDLANNGKVIFGPAARPLPQLHLGVDKQGYLIAMSDFEEPVGPSYWERG